MRTTSTWHPAVLLALLTATPLAAAAAGDGAPATAPPAPAPAAAKPAAAPATAKPATAPAAAKPAAAPAAKPAAAPAAKPAAAPAATAAKPATAPAPTAAKPAAAPAPPAAEANTDPAKANLTLAQATAGIKGSGAFVATIEITREGKPPQAVHCELFADKAPQTVANFIGLARGLRQWKDPKAGQWVKRPLYDGNLLHRVVPDLLIQGGDPSCTVDPGCRGAAGVGDPGYSIPDEIRPELRFDRAGRLAMSNRGAGTAGSQFFITEHEASWLSGGNTIFGQCDGGELIGQLSHVETGMRDVPKAPLTIKRVIISRKGT